MSDLVGPQNDGGLAQPDPGGKAEEVIGKLEVYTQLLRASREVFELRQLARKELGEESQPVDFQSAVAAFSEQPRLTLVDNATGEIAQATPRVRAASAKAAFIDWMVSYLTTRSILEDLPGGIDLTKDFDFAAIPPNVRGKEQAIAELTYEVYLWGNPDFREQVREQFFDGDPVAFDEHLSEQAAAAYKTLANEVRAVATPCEADEATLTMLAQIGIWRETGYETFKQEVMAAFLVDHYLASGADASPLFFVANRLTDEDQVAFNHMLALDAAERYLEIYERCNVRISEFDSSLFKAKDKVVQARTDAGELPEGDWRDEEVNQVRDEAYKAVVLTPEMVAEALVEECGNAGIQKVFLGTHQIFTKLEQRGFPRGPERVNISLKTHDRGSEVDIRYNPLECVLPDLELSMEQYWVIPAEPTAQALTDADDLKRAITMIVSALPGEAAGYLTNSERATEDSKTRAIMDPVRTLSAVAEAPVFVMCAQVKIVNSAAMEALQLVPEFRGIGLTFNSRELPTSTRTYGETTVTVDIPKDLRSDRQGYVRLDQGTPHQIAEKLREYLAYRDQIAEDWARNVERVQSEWKLKFERSDALTAASEGCTVVKTEIERREALLLHSLYVALQGQQDALTPDMLKHFSFRAGGKFPELIAAGVVQLPFIDGDATIESLSMNLRSWESNLVSGILNQIPSIVTLATEYGVRVTELQSWDWHGVDYDTVRRLGLLIKAAGEVGRSITNGTNVEVKARNFGDDSIGLGTISVGSYDIVHPGYYKKLEKDDRAIARHVASFRSVAPVRELHEKFNVRVKNVQSNTHEGRDHADYTDVKLVTTALSGFDQAERLSGAKFSFMSEGTRSLHPTDLRDALDGWEARARSMHKIRRVNQLPELEDIPLLRKMPLGPQFTEFLRRYDALVAELTAEPKPAVEAEKPESS